MLSPSLYTDFIRDVSKDLVLIAIDIFEVYSDFIKLITDCIYRGDKLIFNPFDAPVCN